MNTEKISYRATKLQFILFNDRECIFGDALKEVYKAFKTVYKAGRHEIGDSEYDRLLYDCDKNVSKWLKTSPEEVRELFYTDEAFSFLD